MNDVIPEAYVDGLVILNDAPASVLPMSVNEMHLYSYLGCIFALFKGKPIADWGYPYSITSEGFPWSAEFDHARETLCGASLIEVDDRGLMTPRPSELTAELDTILSLGPWSERRPWLRAAVECALALPIGSIRHAVSRSPGVASSFFLGQRGRLLEPADATLLYEEYEIVASVLGAEAQDVLSPAVIWLSARILRKEDAAV
ncbi:hypothetical protein NKH61_29220 [Mesorhizobium sp. M1005]|uniref:hypothetical protein n=1 Tax=unclassified Mesorhizobium TaxID=325217 RepID=UPI003334FC0B